MPQNLNLGMLNSIMQKIATPEGLNATAEQLAVVAPPDVNQLAGMAGGMQGLDTQIANRIAPFQAQQPSGLDPKMMAGLGQALSGAGQPAPQAPVAPMQVPPSTVPGQFVMQPPAPTPGAQGILARALRGY